jgi:hypothetical protein
MVASTVCFRVHDVLCHSVVPHGNDAEHSSLWKVIQFRRYMEDQGSAKQLHRWTFICRHLSLLDLFHLDSNPPRFQTLGTQEGRILIGGSVYKTSRCYNSLLQPTIPLSIGLPQCFFIFRCLLRIVRHGRFNEFKNDPEYARGCIQCKCRPRSTPPIHTRTDLTLSLASFPSVGSHPDHVEREQDFGGHQSCWK